MDNLNLNSDESILLRTQTVVISGVRHEAILTTRRLIIVESETESIHEDLLFSVIELAVASTNRMREPVITLDINAHNGEIRTIEIRFIRSLGIQNFPERDKCLTIFQEHKVPVRKEVGHESAGAPLSTGTGLKNGVPGTDTPATRPPVPEFVLSGFQKKVPQPDPNEPKERSPLITVAAIILVFAVIISGAFIMGGQETNAKKIPVQPTVTVPVITTAATANPTPIPTPEFQVRTALQPSAPVYTIPPTGVWVRVQYPGNYVGSISTFGRNIAVNNTGTRYYQMSVNHGPIDAFIEKQDGSVDNIEISVFKDGTMVSFKNTTRPLGVVDFHTQV